MFISDPDDVRELMQMLERDRPTHYPSRMEQGSLAALNDSLYYEIDDSGITRVLGDYDQEGIPYIEIVRYFMKTNPEEKQGANMFRKEGKQVDGKTVVPYSRAIEEGIGVCGERAIMGQLAMQDSHESTYMVGNMTYGKDDFHHAHGFNLVFIDGVPHLVDFQNPQFMGYLNGNKDEGNKFRRFVAPIIGIDSAGEIKIPDEWISARNIEGSKYQLPNKMDDVRAYFWK